MIFGSSLILSSQNVHFHCTTFTLYSCSTGTFIFLLLTEIYHICPDVGVHLCIHITTCLLVNLTQQYIY